PDQGLGPRRQERHRLEPYPARDRIDDVEHPPDQSGPDSRRRQRRSDPRSHRRAPAHRLHQGRPAARARPRVPRPRRCAEPEVRGRSGGRADRASGCVLRAADRAGRVRFARHDPRSDVAGRQPPGGLPVSGEGMTDSRRTQPSFATSALRVFDLSLGQMLWSRRSVFLALLVGGPVVLAVAIRVIVMMEPDSLPRVNGALVGGSSLFGMMMWLLYIRFVIPVLGVFYGTALIADEV